MLDIGGAVTAQMLAGSSPWR